MLPLPSLPTLIKFYDKAAAVALDPVQLFEMGERVVFVVWHWSCEVQSANHSHATRRLCAHAALPLQRQIRV